MNACFRGLPAGRNGLPDRGRCRSGSVVLVLLLVLLMTGKAMATGGSGGRSAFVDLVHFPRTEANWGRFHHLQDHLAAAFFQACGQGECARHPVLWPLQLRCAVRRQAAAVTGCVWVIAGSDLRVEATGAMAPDVAIWRCPLPLVEAVAVDLFHAALDQPAPLEVVLPGATQPLREALLDCLEQPGSRS